MADDNVGAAIDRAHLENKLLAYRSERDRVKLDASKQLEIAARLHGAVLILEELLAEMPADQQEE